MVYGVRESQRDWRRTHSMRCWNVSEAIRHDAELILNITAWSPASQVGSSMSGYTDVESWYRNAMSYSSSSSAPLAISMDHYSDGSPLSEACPRPPCLLQDLERSMSARDWVACWGCSCTISTTLICSSGMNWPVFLPQVPLWFY